MCTQALSRRAHARLAWAIPRYRSVAMVTALERKVDAAVAAQTAVSEAAWGALLDGLAEQKPLILRRCAALYSARLESYRTMDRTDLEGLMSKALEHQLAALRLGHGPAADEDVSAYEELGAVRARQGVTLSDLLQAYRVGCDVVRMCAYQIAPSGPGRESLLLRLLELTNAWSDHGMIATAAGHRRAELSLLRRVHERRVALVRRVLSGGLLTSHLRDAAESYGIDVTAAYYAVRGRPADDHQVHDIETFLQTGTTAERPRGLVALIDGDVCGFVTELPRRPAPAVIGVAGPVPLHELAGMFRLATRALETAEALGSVGVFSIASLGLQPAIHADHDMGEVMLDRYVRPFEALGQSGVAILATVERYLQNDCRLEQTARELFVHVNTVRYRLRRFEELTGSSLRENAGLVEAWWALQRRRMLTRDQPASPH